jgi:hypothetical protein
MTINNSVFFATFGSSNPQEAEMGAVCIANISPAERRIRMRFGRMQFAISLGILVALLVFGVNHFWRLLLFFPFSAAATGYFQAKDKT